jgi:hypothetical protein
LALARIFSIREGSSISAGWGGVVDGFPLVAHETASRRDSNHAMAAALVMVVAPRSR